MNNKISSSIFSNKSTIIYVISLIILGIISGSIFLTVLSDSDKLSIINQIKAFFVNVNDQSFLNIKNTLFINFMYIIFLFLMGISIIGLLFNSVIVYIKGFILGFSITSIIYTYGVKGILAAFLYVFPHQIINILVIIIITGYGIIFSLNLVKQIFNKRANSSIAFKKYCIIFGLACVVMIVSSVLETFLMPALFKFIINLYI